MEKNLLLQNFLVKGFTNPEATKQIREAIFRKLHMNIKITKDRVLWSNWINGKNMPSRFAQNLINEALQDLGYERLYIL